MIKRKFIWIKFNKFILINIYWLNIYYMLLVYKRLKKWNCRFYEVGIIEKCYGLKGYRLNIRGNGGSIRRIGWRGGEG